MGRVQEYSIINCAVNPQTGRERSTQFLTSSVEKQIMIVGGGIAGCEAARVLALRGHKPIIFEKSDKLGGNLIPGGMPSFKEDDHALVRWYEAQLHRLNVKIKFNTTVDIADFDYIQGRRFGYDGFWYNAAIIATGSTPKLFSLGDDAHTYGAADVLNGVKDPGKKTVIIGGGLVGCELALHLREKGVEVTIVEALPKILAVNAPLCSANKEMLERLVPYKGVAIKCGAQAKSFAGGKLTLSTGESLDTDSVILCVGYRENNGLYKELSGKPMEVYNLGDSRRVANIMYAIWDAFEVANAI
jgi:2-enoate reductase